MDEQWYVGRNGQKSGPFTTAQLRQMAAAGQLVANDLLWKQGLEQWVPVAKVKGLLPASAGGTLPPLDLQRQPGEAAGIAPADDFDFGRRSPAAAGRSSAPDANPYASPAGSLNVGTAAGASALAGFLPRVGASLLDGIFMFIVQFVVQFGLVFVFGVLSGGNEAAVGVGSLLGTVAGFGLAVLYFVGYETSAKQGTWGKQIVGIKVADMQGRRITVGQAFGRFFAKIITNLTCGIGYLLPLFTDRKQTLHDLICGCLALKK